MNDDFIEIYDNSTSQDLCNELIKWFDFCSENGFTYQNMPGDPKYPKTIKDDESIVYPKYLPVSQISIGDEVSDLFRGILIKCYTHYAEKYDLQKLNLSCFTFKIHKVIEGQGYHVWHHETENIQFCRRVLAWMTYLKVPEEGGETEFLNQSKRIKPVVGKTLIWPAYFTHLHRGNPPLKGEKYYITGWFER